jgi:hypothetical protein
LELLNALLRSGGFEALARQTGCEPVVVTDVAGILIPDLFDAMRAYVRVHGGGDTGVLAMLDMIDSLGDGDLASDILSHAKVAPDAGQALLAQFYSDTASREGALGKIAFESGHDREVVRRIAPYAAMLLSGYLAARASGSGAAGSGGLHGLGALLEALTGPDRAASGPAPD